MVDDNTWIHWKVFHRQWCEVRFEKFSSGSRSWNDWATCKPWVGSVTPCRYKLPFRYADTVDTKKDQWWFVDLAVCIYILNRDWYAAGIMLDSRTNGFGCSKFSNRFGARCFGNLGMLFKRTWAWWPQPFSIFQSLRRTFACTPDMCWVNNKIWGKQCAWGVNGERGKKYTFTFREFKPDTVDFGGDGGSVNGR